MIKKIYEKILKIPFILLIIILSGFLIWEGLGLIGEYQKAQGLKAEIALENYGYADEPYYDLNNYLIENLIEILYVYKDEGMYGVSNIYNDISNELGFKLFDVIIADRYGIYNSKTGITYSSTNNYESNHNKALEAFDKDSPTEVRIARATEMYRCGIYGYKSISLVGYLEEDLLDFLKSRSSELTVRVCATKTGTEYYYRDIEDFVVDEQRIVNEKLEIYVSDAMERISVYVICFTILWLLQVAKIKRNVKGIETRGRLEKLNTEVSLILLIGSLAGVICSLCIYWDFMYYASEDERQIATVVTCAGATVCAIILNGMITNFIKKLCRGCVVADSIIARVIKRIARIIKENYNIENYGSNENIKKLYRRKARMDIIISILVIIIVAAMVPTFMHYPNDLMMYAGLCLIGFYVVFMYYSIKEYKYIRLFNKVNKNIDYLYHGMYEYVDRNDKSEIVMKLANLSQGFEKSVAKQIEAEKLQVELITNVSHDLKTPLTSIISYVDLLPKEELPAVAKDYVKILVDKSERLRCIVSDVFDLAKASSGEEIQLESLDGIILVNQVISDMSDVIDESDREIKIKSDIDTAPITANGQKLYRVFQNVIGNALKYSMPKSRIFINTFMDGNEFVFTIKNVSEFEINFSEEEVLSRFVRGDKSRNSEGNGLGLSIAKSFTEQCGGSFAVNIDDDMFKVIIRLKYRLNNEKLRE